MVSRLLSKVSPPGPDGRIQGVTPESAGWKYVGFEAYQIKSGASLARDTGDNEVCLVLITGRASVTTGKASFPGIGGRMSLFSRELPWSVYVPPGDRFTLQAETDLEVAVCLAPAAGKFPARLIGPESVDLQKRGKGFNRRRVHNILTDNSEAESLLVVEVFTDEGNTSSYPSHKHDTDDPPRETYLEETYYHRFDPPQGWGMQRVYVDDRSLDECLPVYDHDVVLVPKGYHPVCPVAGYDNYYLNVMAGPVKLWKFTWEKDHAWINSDAYPRKREAHD
ncbi:MAG: 5-deoxy-glucuronate isomerase [Planctomycetota bacterium]|jgi:5-deoxy-glucuronate isomerase|nr:5-deoxy-glucuronate isomerase [Planctomycetota bacterium]